MTDSLPLYPFDAELCIGTIIEVGPSLAKTNLPFAAAPDALWHHGNRQGRGEVGDFVLIEVDNSAILGRIIAVRLPERDRLSVEPILGRAAETHPVGTIQLLSTISIQDAKVAGGLANYPRLGAKVFAVQPTMLEWIAQRSQKSGSDKPLKIQLELGTIQAGGTAQIVAPPERLFGRHCAVLGATGGGKSWTVARLVEQAASAPGAKVILLDATGEFHGMRQHTRHIHMGAGDAEPATSTECCFPYSSLTENDLFALFRPSGQVQVPKLRLAMKSLKLMRVESTLARDGLMIKTQAVKARFETAYLAHGRTLDRPTADFDITKLARQIQEECVWPSGGTGQNPNHTVWGNYSDQDKGYCVSLVARIESMCTSAELACILQPNNKPSLASAIEEFLVDPQSRILRVSLKYLSFTYSAREIVANAIGRHLLALARQKRFRQCPVVVFLDEAHQFLDKDLGQDEASRYPLDAFDLIAKEGRKYSLNICIATQRPRDIPEGVLSQMGTLIVHRLINDRDREVVERASGEIDRSAAEFLPTLAPGQAVLIGVDFPIPLTIQMSKPTAEPDSRGPEYQECWSRPPQPIAAVAEASMAPKDVVIVEIEKAIGAGQAPAYLANDDDVPF